MTYLNTMIVRLFAVVGAARVPVRAIIHRGIAHEAVLKRFVAFLVPFEVSDHLLLLDKDAAVAIQTVEVLPEKRSYQLAIKNKKQERLRETEKYASYLSGKDTKEAVA